MVSQPSTWTSNAASDWLQAASDYQMIYSLADVDFRWTFENQNDTRLSLLAGMRYASLDQRLDVDLHARPTCRTCIPRSTSKAAASASASRASAARRWDWCSTAARRPASWPAPSAAPTRRPAPSTAPWSIPVIRPTAWCRCIDAELGTGLSLWNDKLRLTAGYSFSGWFNVVRTDQFIGAVQTNNFTGMSRHIDLRRLRGPRRVAVLVPCGNASGCIRPPESTQVPHDSPDRPQGRPGELVSCGHAAEPSRQTASDGGVKSRESIPDIVSEMDHLVVHFTNNVRDRFVGWDQRACDAGPPTPAIGGPALASSLVPPYSQNRATLTSFLKWTT